MLYDIDPNELVHYIHAYSTFYAYDEYELTDRWLFMKVDEAYVGTYFSAGMTASDYGANKGKEVISYGLKHAVIVKCGSQEEFGSFSRFKDCLLAMEIQYDGEKRLAFTDPQYGLVEIDGTSRSAVVDGQPQDMVFKPDMEVAVGKFQNINL